MAQTYGPQIAPNFKPTTQPVFDKSQYLADKGYSQGQAEGMIAHRRPDLISPKQVDAPQQATAMPKSDVGRAAGGVAVSPATLEKLRASGVPDDVIADEMAKTSTHFATQVKKIRSATQGDPAATSAFLNTRFYGDTQYNPVSKTTGNAVSKSKPKNYITRTLDHIYQQAEDVLGPDGIMAQYNSGDIGAGDAAVRTAGKIFHGALIPVVDPVSDITKFAMDKTGVSGLVQSGVQSVAESDIGQAVAPQLQNAKDWYNNLPAGSNVRNLAPVAQAGMDALTVLGAQGAMDVGSRAIKQGALHPLQTIRHPIQSTKNVWNGTTQLPPQDINPETTKQLMGPAKEAVRKGMDEKLMTFASEQNADTRAVMAKMTEAAHEGGKVLGGTVKHKEILGGQMMDNAAYLLEKKEQVGKALRAMKNTLADDLVDLSDDYVDLVADLRSKGAVINDKGQIISLAGASDDNIPLLQKTLDFYAPNKNGQSLVFGKDIDLWRAKMFEEMNSAKAKLQPSSAGQSAMGFAERITNKYRRSALVKMAKENVNLVRANDAYEELSTAASQYLKAISYKGKLNVDAITAKELRAGEVALRTLGNASADTRDAFLNLLKTARKYGRVSNVDDMKLITYADELENLFPITPTRSIQGHISRGAQDTVGQFTDDAVRAGVKRATLNQASEGIIGKINKMRGMTPENRYRLLMEVLNAPDSTPLIQIVNKVSPTAVPDSVKESIKGVDAGDMSQFAQNELDNLDNIPLSQLSPQGMADANAAKEVLKAGGTVDDAAAVSGKFPGLTPEEVARLTPEEKATGLIGGSDSAFGNPKIMPDRYSPDVRQLAEDFKAASEVRKSSSKFTPNPEAAKKGISMQDSAVLRKLREEPTTIEVNTAKKYLESNYKGKIVEAKGAIGEVQGTAYGKIRVKLEDGSVKSFDISDIKADPVTNRDAIKYLKEQAIKEAQSRLPSPILPDLHF